MDPADADYEHSLLEALWIYQGLNVVEPALLEKVLKAKDYHARASATRILRFWQGHIPNSLELLARGVEDEHMRVRLEAVLACGFSTGKGAAAVALQASKHPMDAGMKHALDNTIRYFERSGLMSQ